MKKIKKALYFYSSVLLLSVILQSCCTNTYKIVNGGTINAYTFGTFDEITTVTGPFSLLQQFETEIAFLQDLSLISSSMALTCEYDYKNSLVQSEFKISCDKDFTYNGMTIEANSDFSQLGEIGLTYEVLQSSPFLDINFPSPFMDNVEFQNEDYTFKLTSKTSDDVELESEITLTINL